jgi:hypothetical protein
MSEFDWVAARAECSIERVFQQIRMGVESDIERMNKLRPANADYGFKIVLSEGKIAVVRQGYISPRSVTFTRARNGISIVNDEGKVTMEATLTLSDDGECRLKINGREREFWQFRRKALEDLFFEVD